MTPGCERTKNVNCVRIVNKVHVNCMENVIVISKLKK